MVRSPGSTRGAGLRARAAMALAACSVAVGAAALASAPAAQAFCNPTSTPVAGCYTPGYNTQQSSEAVGALGQIIVQNAQSAAFEMCGDIYYAPSGGTAYPWQCAYGYTDVFNFTPHWGYPFVYNPNSVGEFYYVAGYA